MSVYQKLSDAREKFHKLKLTKTGHNKFAGYNYFELGDFLIPALGVFKECGLLSVVSFGIDLSSMRIIDIESNGEIVITSPTGSAALKGCHEVQNIGAVETYQRRYLWVAALEIVEHDALDATTGKAPPEKAKAPVTTPTANIGDDLPEEIKTHLADLAAYTVELIQEGEIDRALDLINEENLDGDQKIWMAKQMPTKERNQLKAHSMSRARTPIPA